MQQQHLHQGIINIVISVTNLITLNLEINLLKTLCFLCIPRSHVASAASNAAAISAASQQAAAMHAGAFNSYTGQLAVSVQENAAANGQWAEGKL